MLEGLKLCWEAGFRRVVVEVDSQGVLRQIEGLESNESRVRLQVNDKDWRREDWNTRITYVPYEGTFFYLEYNFHCRLYRPNRHLASFDKGRTQGDPHDKINGLGNQVARTGDKVRIKYIPLGKKDEPGSGWGILELILGQGQNVGFDKAICGMKVDGVRDVTIPKHLCPRPNGVLKKIPTLWNSKGEKKFRVALLTISPPDSGKK
ncbi:uncharacterized protein LOC129290682 isoform X3 [Prosopis cineraria]|uniref:uncharacterized protein LOC129290682 isoform X3 n=1 Tax=Prosopis cineraria TaxID=364024 RepID=UPI00240EA422|nr:uncharacterized protein LOC129290682 isoform X3 [Prosopis cineraria]